MFDALAATGAAFDDHLSASGGQLVELAFHGGGRERRFEEADARLVHRLANLPGAGRLPVAFVTGALAGADLALALACPFVALKRDAALATGFGRPGSAAVYVTAARHVGTPTCERLLFRATPLAADEAGEVHLASVVADASGAAALAAARATTLLSVAKANLVTWPVALAAMRALIDAPDT